MLQERWCKAAETAAAPMLNPMTQRAKRSTVALVAQRVGCRWLSATRWLARCQRLLVVVVVPTVNALRARKASFNQRLYCTSIEYKIIHIVSFYFSRHHTFVGVTFKTLF
jgi:hypothetical protein